MEETKEGRLIWIFFSVVLVVSPLALIMLFKCIVYDGNLDLSLYFNDALLVVFSIMCNLIALCIEKIKTINSKSRGLLLFSSCCVAFSYGAFYFYIKGSDKSFNNDIIWIINCMILCMGIVLSLYIFKNFDDFKNKEKREAEKERQKRKENCLELFNMVSDEKYKYIYGIFEEGMYCEPNCYERIAKSIAERYDKAENIKGNSKKESIIRNKKENNNQERRRGKVSKRKRG